MPDITDAMRIYFGKIKSPSYFALPGQENAAQERAVTERFQRGEYLFPRPFPPDLSAFSAEFGFPLPEAMTAYFQSYHPFLAGRHPLSPHSTESLILYGSTGADPIAPIIRRMRYCVKYIPHFAEERRLVPVGYVTYSENFIWIERQSGRIFTEWNWNEDGTEMRDSTGYETEGNVYPQPLANSLAEFICELNPYH